MIRHALGVCGVMAAFVLLLVSAAMNWRFGVSLGRSELDGLIYGSASAAADCLKALVPFFFFAAVRNRIWSQAAAAAVVGIVVTAYSLTSALGHAALNRNDTASERLAEAEAYKRLMDDLGRAKEQLSWIPSHRPPAMVGAEIGRLKTQRAWTTSDECKLIEGRVVRTLCDKLQALVGEHENGRKAETLEARIAEVQAQLSRFEGTAAGAEADPQAAVLAKILGLKIDQVQLGLTIFVAVLLEVGSGMGLYMAFSVWRIHEKQEVPYAREPVVIDSSAVSVSSLSEPPHQIGNDAEDHTNDDTGPTTDIGRFLAETVRRREGASCAVTSLYERYRRWCAVATIAPLSLPAFARVLGVMGIYGQKRKDDVHYMGFELVADSAWRKAS